MKRVRAFKNIWNVTKQLYIGYKNIKFPCSYRFISVLMAGVLISLVFKDIVKFLPWGDNPLMWHVAVPGGIAYFMDKKTLDDKRPYSFLKTVLAYEARPKNTYMGYDVAYRQERIGKNERITVVQDIGDGISEAQA